MKTAKKVDAKMKIVEQQCAKPWRVVGARYVVSTDNVLIADCYADTFMQFGVPDIAKSRINARIIAKVPKMLAFINAIADMATDRAWSTKNDELIVDAREIIKL